MSVSKMSVSNLAYNSYGKYQVLRVRVSSLSDLRRGDHIAFCRYGGVYWHHAIVEDIDHKEDKIHAIEYHSSEGFSIDNKMTLKELQIATVGRHPYKFRDQDVYLFKHDNCLDPSEVVSRAQSKLGEGKYNLLTNNCEHFAVWCKTATSSSDQLQIKKVLAKTVTTIGAAIANQAVTGGGQEVVKTTVRVASREVLTQTVSNAGQEVVKTTVRAASKEVLTKTVTKAGQEVVKTGIRVASKEAVAQTVSKAGQEVVKTGIRVASKEAVVQTVSNAGQEVVKTGIRVASKEAVVQTVSNAGQEVVKTGIRVASKEAVVQTVTNAGQEVVKTGIRVASKEVVAQTVTNAGQEVVKTGIRVASKEAVVQTVTKAGQEVVKTGMHQATKEVLTQTGSNSGQMIIKSVARKTTQEVLIRTGSEAGQEVVKTGVREVSEEVVTQTVSQPASGLGSSMAAGALWTAAFEGVQIGRDIYYAHADLKKGKLGINEFKTAAKKRVITGVSNVGSTTVATAIGQVLIPVPFVGAVVGGLAGKFIGNKVANFLL